MPDTRKPASPEQFAANQANAAKSTGPKTPEGKARSSQNAVKHGFTAAAFAVVRLEDLQEVANLKADIVSVYQPVNSQELVALERMALAQQAIFRASRLEAGLFTTCMNETMDSQNRPFTPMSPELAGNGDFQIACAQNRNYFLADGFQHQVRKSNVWSLFLRYQAQAGRQYRHALEEFLRLKALRNELPNEPIADQPRETSMHPPSPHDPVPGDTPTPVMDHMQPAESEPAPTPVAVGHAHPLAESASIPAAPLAVAPVPTTPPPAAPTSVAPTPAAPTPATPAPAAPTAAGPTSVAPTTASPTPVVAGHARPPAVTPALDLPEAA